MSSSQRPRSLPPGSTAPPASSGRRTSHRSHTTSANCFKFHNFVFNEANQKFCLEEQHGNKKITVLHWRKSGAEPPPPPAAEVRTCESDSRLLKCHRVRHFGPAEIEPAAGNKRLNTGGVAGSASFPLPVQQQQHELLACSHSSSGYASSLATRDRSRWGHSGSSSSACSGINRSLDDLKLNRRRRRRPPDRMLIDQEPGSDDDDDSDLDLDNDEDEDDDQEEEEEDDDDDDDEDDDDDDEDELFYRTYRERIQQRLDSLLDEATVQSQPLDLSVRRQAASDHNNNAPGEQDSPLSPSELMSAMSCGGRSPPRATGKSPPPPPPGNPFENRVSFGPSPSDMFDALLEEEIHRFLHSAGAGGLDSARRQAVPAQQDFDRAIDEKLRLLHQEVLQGRSFLERRYGDHLRVHFKFDSNKNLEPYRSSSSIVGSGGGTAWQSGSFSNQPSSIGGRLSHRNQIKRHLEDAFKQNGFLIKTKQVSDASNSATFCKFRQLRKYTRYYLKSWQSQLPDEVNKLWKGFLPPPPKTERTSAPAPPGEPSSSPNSNYDYL